MKQTDISLNTTYLIDSAALEHLPSSVRNSILLPFPDAKLTYSFFLAEVTEKGVRGASNSANCVRVKFPAETIARLGDGVAYISPIEDGMRVLARHVMKSKAQWDAELRDAEDRKAAEQVEQERRMREVAALADPVDLAIEVLDLSSSEVSRAGKSLVSALNDLIENAIEARDRIENAFDENPDGYYPLPKMNEAGRRYLPVEYDGIARRVNSSYERLQREVAGYDRVAAVYNVFTRAGLDPEAAREIMYPKKGS
jgi:hypothetical protein